MGSLCNERKKKEVNSTKSGFRPALTGLKPIKSGHQPDKAGLKPGFLVLSGRANNFEVLQNFSFSFISFACFPQYLFYISNFKYVSHGRGRKRPRHASGDVESEKIN